MNKLFKLGAFLLAATTVLVACRKDENRVIFEGGTPPVLRANVSTPLVLARPNASNNAVRFDWTNPEYRFNTGISSQDVNYSLEVDTVGANFTNPKRQSISVARDLSRTFTVKELNDVLSRMELREDVPAQLEFRLRASLGGGSVPLTSNVIRLTVTPYLDVAVPVPPTNELYITGNAMPSDWTNSPPAAQKATRLSNTEYTITVPLVPGRFYKFLSTPGRWQPQYGGSSATGGALGFNMGTGSDPDAIPTPTVAGTYKITLNFRSGQYTVVRQ